MTARKHMTHRFKPLRRLLLVCLCAIFLVSTVRVDLGHLPKLLDVLQEHAEMIADHGHSHGLDEDIVTAMLGHTHGLGDHEHVPDLLLSATDSYLPQAFDEDREPGVFKASLAPIFLFKKPPRA